MSLEDVLYGGHMSIEGELTDTFFKMIHELHERTAGHARESREAFLRLQEQMRKDKEELIEKINNVNINAIEKNHKVELKVSTLAAGVAFIISAVTEALKHIFK